VVHVVVGILPTIIVQGLTEEWFMLWLLYCLPVLFKVLQRSGSCCYYIVYHYCLRFDRGVIHVVVGYNVYHFCVMHVRGVIDVVVGYNVYHNCFWFDRGVVHVVIAILSTITF
jgi:hypothetical protein